MTSKRSRDDLKIPDLGPAPSRPSKSDVVAPARPSKSDVVAPVRPSKSDALAGGMTGDGFFGSGTFDTDDLGDSLDLALDEGGDGATRASGGASGDDEIERTAEGARSLPARPVVDDGHWPTGLSPSSVSIEIDPAELALTAEYGPAPESAFATPLYAVRTLLRQRALAARVRELGAALATAESARDGLLVALVEMLDPVLRASTDGRRLLDPVIRIEALADERRAALIGVNAEYETKLAGLDAEQAALDADGAAAAKAVEQAAAVLEERRLARDRLEARKKRLYIEVRGVLDAVEKAGGHPTPEQAAIIEAREADVAAQKPELERATQAFEGAAAGRAAAEAASREIARRRTDLARRQASLDAEFQKRSGAHVHGVDEAESHRTQAAVDAARAVLAARGRVVDVPRAQREELSQADDRVAAAARELERHVRAVDSYDRSALTTGLAIVAGAVASVLLILLLALR
jgi:hypothetical protein